MIDKIKQALLKLDPANDNHWTADGIPRLETVRQLVGDNTVDRISINAALPGFFRATAAKFLGGQGTTGEHVNAAPAAPVVAQTVTQPQEPTVQTVPAVEQPVDGNIEPDWDAIVENERRLLAPLDEALKKAKRDYDAQVKRVDLAMDAKSAAQGKPDPTGSIMGYLQSRQKQLQHRADQTIALREAGYTPKSLQELIPKRAPIDQVRSRKTGYGQSKK